VFHRLGRRAGFYAAEYAKSVQHSLSVNPEDADETAGKLLAPFECSGGENPYAIHTDLQECMQNLVGIIRTESELLQALDQIHELGQRLDRVSVEGNRQYNPGWHLALSLHSMLAVSEAVTRSALERKESRGGHTRDDYPAPRAEFGAVNVVTRLSEGRLAVTQASLVKAPPNRGPDRGVPGGILIPPRLLMGNLPRCDEAGATAPDDAG